MLRSQVRPHNKGYSLALTVYLLYTCPLIWAGHFHAQDTTSESCDEKLLLIAPTGPVVYPSSPDQSFIETRHLDFRGLFHPEGVTSFVGGLAFATYATRSEDNGQYTSPHTYVGRVISEYEAGLTLLDERTGLTHRLNVNSGELGAIFVQAPSEQKWVEFSNKDGLAGGIAQMKNPWGIFFAYDKKSRRTEQFAGRVVFRAESEPNVFEIVDIVGQIHQLDFRATFTIGTLVDVPENEPNPFQLVPTPSEPLMLVLEPPKVVPPEVLAAEAREGKEILTRFKAAGHFERIAALMLKPSSRMDVGPLLTKEQRKNFKENLRKIGITNERYSPQAHGTPDDWEIIFFHGISIRATQDAGVRELAQTLLTAHDTATDLRQDLNAWAARHELGFQFAFFDDIELLAPAYAKMGRHVAQEEYIGVNGYLLEGIYNMMIQDGIFPVADAHDLLTHLTSLLNPVFRTQFRSYAGFMNRLFRNPRLQSWRDRQLLRKTGTIEEKKRIALYEFLQGTVRDTTHENWSYLVKSQTGEPALFFQGNALFNAVINYLRKGDRDSFVSYVLNATSLSDTTGETDLNSLPGLDLFLDGSLEGRQAYEVLRRLLARHAQTSSSYAKARRTLEKAWDSWGLVVGEKVEREKFPVILRKLAKTISEDRQLSIIYSKNEKERLFKASTRFARLYLEWVDLHPLD